MTLEICLEQCKNFKYAALNSGEHCGCFENLTKLDFRSYSECDYPCTGQGSKSPKSLCTNYSKNSCTKHKRNFARNFESGFRTRVQATHQILNVEDLGDEVFTVLKTQNHLLVNVYRNRDPQTVLSVNRSVWIGFASTGLNQLLDPTIQDYTDANGGRTIADAQTIFDTTLTIEKCLDFCKDYKYAAVQYGEQCWCANEFARKTEILPDSECDMPCEGDPTQTCGGYYKQNIYTV